MKVFGVVYLIWNIVNGKKYVGQTVKTVKARFNEHARQNGIIGRAIRKYGKKNFRYGIVKSCASKADMDYWEKYFIATLKIKKPNGYNQTDGGEGIVGCTDEIRAKISAKRKGVKKSPEHRLNIALSLRGMTPYKNLLNEIEKRHLKYFEVAELLGLSASNFRNKMCGRYHFTDKDIDKLVEFFGLPAEYLMARDDVFRQQRQWQRVSQKFL
ncbi:MAG: GIY-YIG nuclease family protein [Quinella sp. 3Q1]|nr:GIY-YIG nuclease family protein [Quinella sp. 3Q1]